MSGASRAQAAGRTAWRVFAGALAVTGWLCGLYGAVLLSQATGLYEYPRNGPAFDGVGTMPMSALGFFVAVLAKPRDWRQLALLLVLVTPLSFWFGLTEDAGLAAQHAIAPRGSIFILWSVFALLAVPALALVWRIIERAGMAEPDEDEPAWPAGGVPAIAIVLPGLFAGTLLIDILRAVGWMQGDTQETMAWAIAPMVFALLVVMPRAQPRGAMGCTIAVGAVAAALIATVLAGAGMQNLAGPLDEPAVGTAFLGVATIPVGACIGWAARAVGHRLAGRDSPWQAKEQINGS